MRYETPEITTLGNAAYVIQGTKNGPGDGDGKELPSLDRELDD